MKYHPLGGWIFIACGAWSILILKKWKSSDSGTHYPPRKAQADNSAGHRSAHTKLQSGFSRRGAAQMRQKSFISAVKRRKEGFKG